MGVMEFWGAAVWEAVPCISVAKAKVVAAAQAGLQLCSLPTVPCVICATSEALGSCALNSQGQLHLAWEWPGTALWTWGVLWALSLLFCCGGHGRQGGLQQSEPGNGLCPCLAGSGRAGGPGLPLQWESLGQGLRKTSLFPIRYS